MVLGLIKKNEQEELEETINNEQTYPLIIFLLNIMPNYEQLYKFYKREYLTLKNQIGGKDMPKICLGTVQGHGSGVEAYLEQAYALGYRHIDCADAYIRPGYMEGLKSFIHQHDRSELWITWKGSYLSRIPETLKKLDCGYFDLYLIHHDRSCESSSLLAKLREYRKAGLISEFGISNCNKLPKLLEYKISFPELYALQIQAFPDLDELIKAMSEAGVHVMLFGMVSGVVEAINREKIGYDALDIVPNLVSWYIQKYPQSVPIVGTITGSTLEVNMTSFNRIKSGRLVLSPEEFRKVESFLMRNRDKLAIMY